MAKPVKSLHDAYPRLKTITAMFADLNGIMRGKVLPVGALDKLVSEGILLPASIFGTDATGESVAATGLVWETGDRDYPCQIIEESFHDISGGEGIEAACLLKMMTDSGKPHPLDPRNILVGVVERLASAGFYPVIAPELEFYLIDRKSDSMGMGRPAPTPQAESPQATNQIYGIEAYDEFAGVIGDIRDAAMLARIRADTAITEYGRGQYEINILHRQDAVRAADEAALFRYHTRRTARRHGLDTTFMGKPFADDTGNGFHLHVSLLDNKGRNILAEQKGQEALSNPSLTHAVGGLCAHLGESMAVFAPNANAWRRLAPGHYAPTDKSWGFNNRTVNFRIPKSDTKARRIEHRASSADINPYLAIALILAAMAEGITRKIDPPPMTEGNAYENQNRDGLPRSWGEANRLFAESPFIASWLGEEYRKVYTATKEYERATFEAVVTPLDWEWYR